MRTIIRAVALTLPLLFVAPAAYYLLRILKFA